MKCEAPCHSPDRIFDRRGLPPHHRAFTAGDDRLHFVAPVLDLADEILAGGLVNRLAQFIKQPLHLRIIDARPLRPEAVEELVAQVALRRPAVVACYGPSRRDNQANWP